MQIQIIEDKIEVGALIITCILCPYHSPCLLSYDLHHTYNPVRNCYPSVVVFGSTDDKMLLL